MWVDDGPLRKMFFFFSRKPSTTLRDQSLFITQRGGVGGVRRISGITWFQGGTEGGSVVANRILRGDCKGGNIKILQSLLGKSGILLHTTHSPPSSSPSNK